MKLRQKCELALKFYNQCLDDGTLRVDILAGLDHQCKLNHLAQVGFPDNLVEVRKIDDKFEFLKIEEKEIVEKIVVETEEDSVTIEAAKEELGIEDEEE